MSLWTLCRLNGSFLVRNKVVVVKKSNYANYACRNCFYNFRSGSPLPRSASFYYGNVRRTNFFSNSSNWKGYCTKAAKVGQEAGKEALAKPNLTAIKTLKKSHVRRLLSLAKPEKWKIISAVGLLLISSSVTMAVPFSLGKVLDIIYTSTSDMDSARERLNGVCLMLGGIFLLGGVCNFGRVYLMSISGQRMTQALRQKVFSSILKQEAGWFDSVSTGQLVNRLSSDAQLVGSTLSSNISDGLRSFFMVTTGAGMMFYMSTELALVGLSVVPPIAGLAIIYGRFVRKITNQVQDRLAEATQVAEEKISNIRTVKIFSKELVESEKYNLKIADVLQLAYKESLARGIFYGMTGLSGNIIIISVLYYGGILVSTQNITVGNLTSFLLYAAYIGVSIGGLSSFYSELNKGIGAAGRLWEIMDRVPTVPSMGGLRPNSAPRGEIVFEDVTFSYPSRPGKNVLEKFNLRIEPGKSLALVGGSGSGKTTVALLLLRLYEPQSGTIKLDGVDIREYDPRWLRQHIGTVNQEPTLFSTSIRENILYGFADADPAATDAALLERRFADAVALARVDEFAPSLPRGYATRAGERGAALSGGQRQRVAIARACVGEPRVLVLDEATSALDPRSEHAVREALRDVARRRRDRTVLTIAHRPSTIRAADEVCVLEGGRVVERGAYEELVRAGGAFGRLVRHRALDDDGEGEGEGDGAK